MHTDNMGTVEAGNGLELQGVAGLDVGARSMATMVMGERKVSDETGWAGGSWVLFDVIGKRVGGL